MSNDVFILIHGFYSLRPFFYEYNLFYNEGLGKKLTQIRSTTVWPSARQRHY